MRVLAVLERELQLKSLPPTFIEKRERKNLVFAMFNDNSSAVQAGRHGDHWGFLAVSLASISMRDPISRK